MRLLFGLIPAALAVLAGASSAGDRGLPARPLDPPAAAGAMAPNLSLAGDGTLLTWLEPAATKTGKGHRLRFSRLQGDRWSAPATIASGSRFFANWADFPGAVQGQDGTIVAHWLERSGESDYAYGVKLARSRDGGATWTPAGSLHPEDSVSEHGFVAWVPESGSVRAFWLDGREMKGMSEQEGAMALRTATVTGGKPRADERLDGRVCSCCQTDAALAASGPVIAYRDRSEEEVRDVSVIRRTASGWSKPVRVHADHWKIPGCPVNGPAIAASGRRVAVAWFTAAPPNPRVQIAFSEDGGATFGPAALVDGDKPFGRVDLALDANGDALVSWLAAGGKGADLRLRRVTAGGKLGRPITLAATSGARSSGFPRLVRAGGRLLLAWVDDGEPSKVRAAAVGVKALR